LCHLALLLLQLLLQLALNAQADACSNKHP
jgi:hypothetical protein